MPGSGGIGVKRRVFSPGSAGEESEQGTYTKTHTDGRTQTCTQTHAHTGDTRIHVQLRDGRAHRVSLAAGGSTPLARADPHRAGCAAVAYLTRVGEKGRPVTADGGGPGGTPPEVPASLLPAGED